MTIFDLMLRLRGVDRELVSRVGDDHALIEYTFEIDDDRAILKAGSGDEKPQLSADSARRSGEVGKDTRSPEEKKK
ncbi:hypothetical protein [Lentzea waywayandensis]|uniref:hypothetical protein n=1 Tax=Lentzea waywayandensis TaxID=84724 RepID=UPI001160278D|nr:hypothetical protein [Lentzea waywayandensis]